ncbi:hypothetical protein K458DRAFT_153938 [Lentithecium fluviatile CBS 122367]|uniref:Uncharacterized protein n=1 Tax=Lentithecium fluviatile CBS 122367 TaxID=1168545 RepID=A0A6G1JEE5_9PLEO|nr:hypothetical protein K458DRAFT_153938 [Lentithecium fluviatile CBS 122367]
MATAASSATRVPARAAATARTRARRRAMSARARAISTTTPDAGHRHPLASASDHHHCTQRRRPEAEIRARWLGDQGSLGTLSTDFRIRLRPQPSYCTCNGAVSAEGIGSTSALRSTLQPQQSSVTPLLDPSSPHICRHPNTHLHTKFDCPLTYVQQSYFRNHHHFFLISPRPWSPRTRTLITLYLLRWRRAVAYVVSGVRSRTAHPPKACHSITCMRVNPFRQSPIRRRLAAAGFSHPLIG